MFDLDLKSRLPIYEQLVEKLKQLIVTDILTAHEQLPSVRQLASQLTINPNTIQKAYRELEQLGFIYSLPGKGSFVSPVEKNSHGKRLAEILEQLEILLSEAHYLGLDKETLIQRVENAYNTDEGDL